MTLSINRAAAMTLMTERFAQGLDRGLNEMTSVALQHAPVRKDTARKPTSREQSVKALKENFIPDRTRHATVMGRTVATRRPPIVSSLKKFNEARHSGLDIENAAKAAELKRGAGTFTFKFVGARSGTEVGNIGYDPKRARLTAKARARGGNLKSKIRRTEVVIDGTQVSGKLISGAPYSAPIEFGYHGAGKGGTSSHGAQPFMRPAREHYRSNWRGYFSGKR